MKNITSYQAVGIYVIAGSLLALFKAIGISHWDWAVCLMPILLPMAVIVAAYLFIVIKLWLKTVKSWQKK